jgi:SHS2 domain-containing protein
MGEAHSGYELLPHTADAALSAWGSTLAELFEQAAAGMYALMLEEPESVRPAEMRYIELSAPDRDHLLVTWLLELLFLSETESLLFRSFEVTLDDGRALHAEASGERLDPQRHHIGAVVKAVTLHGLKIVEDAHSYRIEVLFDI